ncbi:MAG: tRNA lysidine(34) synthetase TilS [Coprobacillus sp.]|nr:tRNA lysidine(34) synthetase TilS [Coprobacillus sp.]
MSEKSKDLSSYLSKDGHYLLACSFGPDSMALFYLLKNEGYSFDVAHVNYHLREESDEEEESLKKVCENYGISFHVYEVEKGSISGNIEGTCRQIRYDYFVGLIKENGYDALLVAHQEDDLLETYLLQSNRQAIVDFYGLKERSAYRGIQVIRPLLGYTKKELLDIVTANNIPYSIDVTNFDISLKRNKLRHTVVEKLDRAERDKLLLEIEDKNRAQKEAVNRLSLLNLHKSSVLLTLSEDEFHYALILLLNEAGIYYPLSKKNAQNIFKALVSNKPNIRIKLREFCFEKSYGECRFFKDEAASYCFVVDSPMVIDTDYFHFDLINNTKFTASPNDYPLTIRNARPDDVIVISGFKVKVSRLYIDWKMPLKYRDRWPIVINRDGTAIYIPHFQSDFTMSESSNFYVKL